MESSYCQQAVTFFFFFWSSTYSWPGPLTLWPAPPPLIQHQNGYTDDAGVTSCLISYGTAVASQCATWLFYIHIGNSYIPKYH